MFTPPESRWSVPFDGDYDIRSIATSPPPESPSKKELRTSLNVLIKELDELQYRLYVEDRHSLLLIFQALDAGGKDSTIRAVFRGVNPAGLQVTSFQGAFLLRTRPRLPLAHRPASPRARPPRRL